MKKQTGYASIDNPQNIGYDFFKTHPIIPNMDVYHAIQMLSTFYNKRDAIECLDLKVKYAELLENSVTVSLALKELGVKRGDIISVCMPNFYQAVAVFLACSRIGAVTTFLNYGSSQDEMNKYLNLFESPIFINYAQSRDENINIKKNTKIKYIVTLDKYSVRDISLFKDYHITSDDDLIDFNSLGGLAKFQKKKFELHSAKENALILFTSGSTGKPKSVVLTNENVLAAGTYLKNSSKVKSLEGNRTLVCVPFSYPYGFVTSTLMSLLSLKTAILAPNISKDTISYYLSKNPNIIFGSPALLDLIINNVPQNQDLSSVTQFISGGDFLTPSHYQRGKSFFASHGATSVEIGNGSGNAETVSCGTNPVGIEIRPETVGKVLVGTFAMVVDSVTLEEKRYGEEGLLCISGKHVFKEYYKDPIMTDAVKFERNGKIYFKTGMMGYLNKDGYFTLTARESRFYIMSTLDKVYCDHVQNFISYFDFVKSCAVVPVPDSDLLYVNKAYVVLKEGIQPDSTLIHSIYQCCTQPIQLLSGDIVSLKKYEIPSYVEFISELPRKAGTDKIDYDTLEKDAAQKVKKGKVLVLQ